MLQINQRSVAVLAAVGLGLVSIAPIRAATVPFTEEFSSDPSNWATGATQLLTWNANGGPDGSSFVSSTVNFGSLNDTDPAIAFRGQQSFGSSSGAFVGDWLAQGVDELSFWVRHNASVPLNFFSRTASSANFPGLLGIGFVPVQPNTWTQFTLSLDEMNPAIVLESGSFSGILSDVGNIQVGVSVPTGLGGVDQDITISLDKVAIVPEPFTGVLLLAGLSAVYGWRRKGS